MRLRLALLVLLLTACGGEGQPAVVVAADETEIGGLVSGGFAGPEPEFMALLDEMLPDAARELDLDSGSVVILTAFDPELQSRARNAVTRYASPEGPDLAALALRRSDAAIVAVAQIKPGQAEVGLFGPAGAGFA